MQSELPLGWQNLSIGSIARVRRGASPRPIDNPNWFSTEGPGWVRIVDVTRSNGKLYKTEQCLSPQGVARSVPVKPGQLIMSICATIGEPAIVQTDVCIHDGFVVFDEHENNLNVQFLFHWLRHRTPEFRGLGQTGTQANLNTGIIESTYIQLPPISEQQEIAYILDTIDEVIATTIAHIEKLKLAKAGLLCDLLTSGIDDNGEVRNPRRYPEQFKESELGLIPKDWDLETLFDVALGRISNGFFKKPELVGSGYRLVNVLDLYQDFGIDLNLVERVNASEKEYEKYSIQEGDCFFTRSSLNLAGIAHCNIIRNLTEPALFECHLMRVRPNQNKIYPEFLAHWCRSDFSRRFLMARAKQVTMTTISQPDIAPLPVPIPAKAEQKEIVHILNGHDERILLKESKLEKLRLLKQGLMSDLLSGRVRTKVDSSKVG